MHESPFCPVAQSKCSKETFACAGEHDEPAGVVRKQLHNLLRVWTIVADAQAALVRRMMFLQGCNLLGPEGVTTRAARTMFVKVNLDDELFEQSDSDNDATELVFEEFQEVVVRLADDIWGADSQTKAPEPVVKGDLATEEAKLAWFESLGKMFEWFVNEELTPRALKKGKYK